MIDKRRTPARPDLAAEHLRGKVQAERFATGEEKAVIATWTNLLDRPAGRVVSQLLLGDRFVVYEDREGFAWGQNLRDDHVGYLDSTAIGAPGPAANAFVTRAWAPVYREPDIKSAPPLAILPFQAAVNVLSADKGFARLAEGYSPVQLFRTIRQTEADFTATAERFLGTPYLWGGCTPMGFDCSGLVQIALLAAGIRAPRDSDQQAALGRGLAENDQPQRGDLVFWRGHVGIMQDSRRLIHANAHHMAVASEDLDQVAARILGKNQGEVLARRRLS